MPHVAVVKSRASSLPDAVTTSAVTFASKTFEFPEISTDREICRPIAGLATIDEVRYAYDYGNSFSEEIAGAAPVKGRELSLSLR